MQKTGRVTGIFILTLILYVGIAIAQDADISAGKQLVDTKTPCDQLTEDQLVQIGDYIMETMHPGDAHKQLEQQLGGEGSAQLKQTHLQMAQQMYCDKGMMGSRSAGMMGGRSGGMMGYREAETTDNREEDDRAQEDMGCQGQRGRIWDDREGFGTGYRHERGERFGFALAAAGIWIIATFLFSIIFWGTHRWMNKRKK